VTGDEISFEKKKGNANNDWVLSKRIIEAKSNERPSLQQVTDVFEKLYQGTPTQAGLCATEDLIPSKGLLREVHSRCSGRVAIVTGRPRKDCAFFLETHGLSDLFPVHLRVCMEDGPCKPDPFPVAHGCKLVGVTPSKCMMIGDTPDDIKSAKAAGLAAPVGVLTPGNLTLSLTLTLTPTLILSPFN
jgi:HAD superfamily hydrolase (TIGR01548 family)